MVNIEFPAFRAATVIIQKFVLALGEWWAFLGSAVVTIVLVVVVLVHATSEVAQVVFSRSVVSVVAWPVVRSIIVVVVGSVSIMFAIGLVVVLGSIWVVPILVTVVLMRVMFDLGTLVFISRALIFGVAGIAAVLFAVSFVE